MTKQIFEFNDPNIPEEDKAEFRFGDIRVIMPAITSENVDKVLQYTKANAAGYFGESDAVHRAKKAILRQDPNVILMGEVRDAQSAQFAVEAANTGHLVFTTLHANSSVDAFERLVELEVEPAKIATSALAIFAQRLVKKVCHHCYIERDITSEEIEMLQRLEIFTEETIPKTIIDANPDGCPICGNTGFVGRTLVDEVIAINQKIRELITNRVPAFEIRKEVSKMGYKAMVENGIEKMKNKETTLEEVLGAI